ncbi:MAG: hypothetical protein EBW51_09315 [Actinobacteria bacterium]|jgi:hypothetical protein|nr:hypothetical protein [Actinomycetota bacterium]
MRFYIIESREGSALGAYTTLREAVAEGRAMLGDEFEICGMDIDVTAENIRRLVGNMGAYAKGESTYYDNRGRRLPEGE